MSAAVRGSVTLTLEAGPAGGDAGIREGLPGGVEDAALQTAIHLLSRCGGWKREQ
jgi:hypothetical protein